MYESHIYDETGLTYVLVIDTTAYAAHFERELCAYATGIFNAESGVGRAHAALARAANPEICRSLASKSKLMPHAQYGLAPVTVRSTPGRSNNGMGVCRDLKPGEDPQWPAFESLAIFFNERLSDAELDFIKARSYAFAAQNDAALRDIAAKAARKTFSIKDIYLICIDVTKTKA